MLKPNKYTDIRFSVLGISFLIIEEMNNNEVIGLEDLKLKLVKRCGERVNENFFLSLAYLYLIGKLKYHSREDVIEFMI
jgi:hypothetical protein